MDNIVLTFNNITIQLRAAQFMNLCRMFLSPFGKPHMVNPTKILLHRDVTDWFKSPLNIYCSLRMELIVYKFSKLLFHTETTRIWFLLMLDSLTDGLLVLLEQSSIQLGLPQNIGVLEQMVTLIF